MVINHINVPQLAHGENEMSRSEVKKNGVDCGEKANKIKLGNAILEAGSQLTFL